MPLDRGIERRVQHWDELDGDTWFAFEVFWAPPVNASAGAAGGAWRTWDEFFADYLRVRPQALAVNRSIHVRGPGRPFAEEALREHGRAF